MKVRTMRRDVWAVAAPTAMWRYRDRSGARRGLTLIELLAAMMVLLVGVYAVAALFPKLSLNIAEEERGTSMSRSVGQFAAGLQAEGSPVIGATAPLDANLDAVDPNSRPADPDSVATGANSRDDFVVVYEEWLKVPAPTSPSGLACYIPRLGLIAQGVGPTVFEDTELKLAYRDPGRTLVQNGELVSGKDSAGTFYLRDMADTAAGDSATDVAEVILPRPSVGSGTTYQYRVDYDWYDPAQSLRKRVMGELVPVVAPTGTPSNIATVPRSFVACRPSGGWRTGWPMVTGARAWRRVYRSVSVGTYGQAAYFDNSLVGHTLRMNYVLRVTSNWRRDQVMQEERVLPTAAPYDLPLTFGDLDDEQPLMSQAFSGTAISPVWVLMVDLSDGAAFVYDTTPTAAEGISSVDFRRGVVTINAVTLSARLGHQVRLYYRTADQHCLQVQKTPAEFVEVADGVTCDTPWWQHRSYQVSSAGSGGYFALDHFPAYLEDQAVQVDYLAGSGTPLRISNELHVISDLGDVGGTPNFGFVLNQPAVAGVLAVRGGTMRVSGWWRAESGRVKRVDITQMLFGVI